MLQMNRNYEELKSSAHTFHATNLHDLLHEKLIYWEGHRPTFHIQESSHISLKDNTEIRETDGKILLRNAATA